MFRLIGIGSIAGLIFAPQLTMRIVGGFIFGLIVITIGMAVSAIPFMVVYPVLAIAFGASEKTVSNSFFPAMFFTSACSLAIYLFLDMMFKTHMSEVFFGSWFDPTIYTEGVKYWFIEACDFAILNTIVSTPLFAMTVGLSNKN